MDLLSRLFLFSPMKEENFTNVFTQNISKLAIIIKSSNVLTKETSQEQILLQTLQHLREPQINLVSL